jgi:hypothetical protein
VKEYDGIKAASQIDRPSYSGSFRAQEETSSLMNDGINDEQEDDDFFYKV